MAKRLRTIEEYKRDESVIHNGKYEVLSEELHSMHDILTFKCKQCGRVFQQEANAHLQGQGCKYCYYKTVSERRKMSYETFLEKLHKVHGDKYIPIKETYKGSIKKMDFICPKHGIFQLTPHKILQGRKCQKCSHEEMLKKQSKTLEQFIKDAREIHGNYYDYSKVEYVNARTPITIICPIHGEFQQTPDSHLRGHGCNLCQTSKLENEIKLFLDNENIEYTQQVRKTDFPFLNRYSVDFFIKNTKYMIECQGIQHFKALEHFGHEEGLNDILKRDIIKNRLLVENGYEVLYYSNFNKDIDYKSNIYNGLYSNIIHDKNILLEIIKQEKNSTE